MIKKSAKSEVEVSILELKTQSVEYCLLGITPFFCNRMPEKVKRQLALPPTKKTAADKASTLKHQPYEEFSDSPYRIANDDAPTLIAHLATAFKGAIADTAIDTPGAKKAQIARLLWVENEKIPLYGIPKLHMAVAYQAGMNRTPDIRTRCMIPEWAARVTVSFSVPLIKEPTVTNLFAAAGQIQGVGDWRNGKGKGNFGRFRLVSQDDPDFIRITREGGRAAQIEAMQAAEPYDNDTEDLLSWFAEESKRRGFDMKEAF